MGDLDRAKIIALSDLKPEEVDAAKPDWAVLGQIHDHYLACRGELEPAAQMVQATLRRAPKVHSVFFRVKDPEHLVAKLLRKQSEQPGRPFRVEDYATRVTDLVGARVLHLFKEDWAAIHDFILETWEQAEQPKAKVRHGDDTKGYAERGCEVEVHPAGYRSVHYLVSLMPTKLPVIAEVQVRTIFEEAWAEIDHTIRYPHNKGDPVLNQFLGVFNQLAGNADGMGSFIRSLHAELAARRAAHTREVESNEREIASLQAQIEQLKIDTPQKELLRSGLDSLLAKSGAFTVTLDSLLGLPAIEDLQRRSGVVKESGIGQLLLASPRTTSDIANPPSLSSPLQRKDKK